MKTLVNNQQIGGCFTDEWTLVNVAMFNNGFPVFIHGADDNDYYQIFSKSKLSHTNLLRAISYLNGLVTGIRLAK